jgi:hypothetical protein
MSYYPRVCAVYHIVRRAKRSKAREDEKIQPFPAHHHTTAVKDTFPICPVKSLSSAIIIIANANPNLSTS